MVDRSPLYALAYTSKAVSGLTDEDLARIQASASRINALDGVTGLLLFTGSLFVQIVEGAQDAIEDLSQRLRADERHREIHEHFLKPVERRSFPSWDMKTVRLSTDRDAAIDSLAELIPATASDDMRANLRTLVSACYA